MQAERVAGTKGPGWRHPAASQLPGLSAQEMREGALGRLVLRMPADPWGWLYH